MRRGLWPGRTFGLFMARWVERWSDVRVCGCQPAPVGVVGSLFEAAWSMLPGQRLRTCPFAYAPNLTSDENLQWDWD